MLTHTISSLLCVSIITTYSELNYHLIFLAFFDVIGCSSYPEFRVVFYARRVVKTILSHSFVFYTKRILRTLRTIFGRGHRSFPVPEHRLKDLGQRKKYSRSITRFDIIHRYTSILFYISFRLKLNFKYSLEYAVPRICEMISYTNIPIN